AHEAGAGPGGPEAGPLGEQPLPLAARLHSAPLDRIIEAGVGRVIERTQQAGDIGERRALEAALRERPRGLALEIDDDEIAPRPQRLAEVVIAVAADADGVDGRVGDAPDGAEGLALAVEQVAGE